MKGREKRALTPEIPYKVPSAIGEEGYNNGWKCNNNGPPSSYHQLEYDFPIFGGQSSFTPPSPHKLCASGSMNMYTAACYVARGWVAASD